MFLRVITVEAIAHIFPLGNDDFHPMGGDKKDQMQLELKKSKELINGRPVFNIFILWSNKNKISFIIFT